MDTIIGILGFLLGIALFVLALNKFQMIFIGFQGIIGLFILCWVFGTIIAWIAWKIAILVGIIALIVYAISKFSSKSSANDSDATSEENANTDEQQEN